MHEHTKDIFIPPSKQSFGEWYKKKSPCQSVCAVFSGLYISYGETFAIPTSLKNCL